MFCKVLNNHSKCLIRLDCQEPQSLLGLIVARLDLTVLGIVVHWRDEVYLMARYIACKTNVAVGEAYSGAVRRIVAPLGPARVGDVVVLQDPVTVIEEPPDADESVSPVISRSRTPPVDNIVEVQSVLSYRPTTG